MVRVKCLVSGFDGRRSYKAGDVIDTTVDHAKTVVGLGHGVLVDDAGDELTSRQSAEALGLVAPLSVHAPNDEI